MAHLHKARNLALALLSLVAACGGSGLGANVRSDIRTQVATIQEPVAACYEAALERDRKLRGRMLVGFDAAPKTGEFTNVHIVESELSDPDLERCVTEHVARLRLSTPQKAKVAASYPLDFAPTN